YRMLGARGIEVPEDLLGGGNKSEPTEPSEALQERLVEAYRIDPELRMLLELMTDFDEGLQEWRYRHVKMVERTIGNKRGTGGSPGAEFLKRSLFKPLFPDLWAIRHRL
ncbi:MAG: tryptophan 2,3-dioxygenase family protein, partial [Gemmatimonadales bacterium]